MVTAMVAAPGDVPPAAPATGMAGLLFARAPPGKPRPASAYAGAGSGSGL